MDAINKSPDLDEYIIAAREVIHKQIGKLVPELEAKMVSLFISGCEFMQARTEQRFLAIADKLKRERA